VVPRAGGGYDGGGGCELVAALRLALLGSGFVGDKAGLSEEYNERGGPLSKMSLDREAEADVPEEPGPAEKRAAETPRSKDGPWILSTV
jgi:hypothetical protein